MGAMSADHKEAENVLQEDNTAINIGGMPGKEVKSDSNCSEHVKKGAPDQDGAITLKVAISGMQRRSNGMVLLAAALIFLFTAGYMYWPNRLDKQGAYIIFLIIEVILFLFSRKILDNMDHKAQNTEEESEVQPSSNELEVLDTIHFYQMCFLIYGVFLAAVLLVVFIGLWSTQDCFLHQIAIGFQNLVTGDLFSLMGGSFASFMVFTQFREMYKCYRQTQSAE